MYESIFNRIEQKYLLNENEFKNLYNKIENYIEKDKFFESNICNIYFDNDNYDMIINSIEKPPFKQKLRLRSYGVPKDDDYVFLEIKTKYKKIVTKRRIKLTMKSANMYLNDKVMPENTQIMKEIDYLFKYYQLKPAFFVAYDRKSYRGVQNKALRITFDENLRGRTTDLHLENEDYGEKYFKDNIYIMEIKCLNSFPMWLVKILSELKIYPTSFSKIGNIYKKEMEMKKC